ncbi:MAG: arsenate reductase [Deltaproteobacteria bacterium]|nr:MAG: arsenate reductase [Deltaproteobacteria bacterium]
MNRNFERLNGRIDRLSKAIMAGRTADLKRFSRLERRMALLAGPPADLVRKDKRFKELGLRGADYVTREQVVGLLLEHPELMERPVVVHGKRAVIARPSERVEELLGSQ